MVEVSYRMLQRELYSLKVVRFMVLGIIDIYISW
jgi:hypothetical protein